MKLDLKLSRLAIVTVSGLVWVQLLSGCLMTREDVAEEEQKKNVQQQVTTLQKTTADTQNHYSEVNEEMRELSGKIEALDNRISNNNKEREKSLNSTDQLIADTNKKNQALQEEVQKLENQVSFLNQEMVKMSAAQQAAQSVQGAGTVDKKTKKDPNTFKYGEDLFNKKEWREAILNYQKYRDSYPTGKNYPMATYKIALAFQELGMKDEARTFFEDLTNRFPDSPLAKQAKIHLKKK
jgi:TolA-binding protein